jgi:predicted hydrocarbon binding protein
VEEVEDKITSFLAENWKEAFSMLWDCVLDFHLAVELPPEILYSAGKKSGERTGKWILEQLNLGEKSVKERTHYSNVFLEKIGIGKSEFIKEPERKLCFRGGTYFARSRGRIGWHVCGYYAGFIAGMTESLIGKKVEVKEVSCFSVYDPDCIFAVRKL